MKTPDEKRLHHNRRCKKYYLAHKEKIKKYNREYFKQYRLDNLERVNQIQLDYVERNHDAVLAYHKQYYRKNKAHLATKKRERYFKAKKQKNKK